MVNLDFGSLGFTKRAFLEIGLLDQMYAKVGGRTLKCRTYAAVF